MATNIFEKVQLQRPNSSHQDLTHDVKLSCNMGELIPTCAIECVPGDKFSIGCDALVRFAPLIAPMMHRVDIFMHYFFVPNRLTWRGITADNSWELFITNKPNGGGFVPTVPTITINDASYTSLCDYLGLPTPPGAATDEVVSALPFAAYQLIYNEYYRDQNLSTKIEYLLTDGNNTANGELRNLRRRAWERDYFTSALPDPQQGGTVEIPLAGFADIPVYRNTPTITAGTDITVAVGPTPLDIPNIPTDQPDIADDVLYADTSELTINNTSITDLRRAYKLQEWLELANRGGSRYVESIYAMFGVKSPDARLNRPEYITGTKSALVISEVLNTTGTDEAAQGDMAGHGVSITQGRYGGYFCQEHGYIIGIMSVLPKTAYQQGIPRHFLKRDTFDYFFKQFEHIGEQAIENREIFAYDALGGDTFGYTPRYAEYKYLPNRVAGDFKTSLNFWHLGRIFDAIPVLNQEFIESTPSDRIFAVTDEGTQKVWCHILHKISARRPMSLYGNPHL